MARSGQGEYKSRTHPKDPGIKSGPSGNNPPGGEFGKNIWDEVERAADVTGGYAGKLPKD